MISKDMFIAKITNEVRILKHLASKATTPELLNFRFSDKQRTTAQWLAYLALVGSAVAKEALNDDWSGFELFNDKYENFDPATFGETIDADLAEIIAIVEAATPEKFAEGKSLWGMPENARAWHILSINDLYVAYKTEIFLQLKAAGLSELETMNLWAGMDAPAKA